MKTKAVQELRRKLAEGSCVYGLWVTLESASITEMAVALGLDWVVVDAEHGHLDWRDVLEHVRATVRNDRGELRSAAQSHDMDPVARDELAQVVRRAALAVMRRDVLESREEALDAHQCGSSAANDPAA